MAGINPQFKQIGAEFVKQYYLTFDGGVATRPKLTSFYHRDAMLSFEGDEKQGISGIMDKIQKLPFINVQHAVTTLDCQPTLDGGVLIMVTGQIKVDEEKPMGFSHNFCLKAEGTSFSIIHEVFRLSLHNFADASS
ncbi:hypothetical protein ScPMuIL_000701 [Solemya velum]